MAPLRRRWSPLSVRHRVARSAWRCDHVPNGPVLIVDCYNANPASTEAALRSLAALQAERKVALLGLMAELGTETEAEHQRVARLAEELGIEVVGYQTELYGSTQVSAPMTPWPAPPDLGPPTPRS